MPWPSLQSQPTSPVVQAIGGSAIPMARGGDWHLRSASRSTLLHAVCQGGAAGQAESLVPRYEKEHGLPLGFLPSPASRSPIVGKIARGLGARSHLRAEKNPVIANHIRKLGRACGVTGNGRSRDVLA
jgi:hypothetical protein